jgi:hypothetical protein
MADRYLIRIARTTQSAVVTSRAGSSTRTMLDGPGAERRTCVDLWIVAGSRPVRGYHYSTWGQGASHVSEDISLFWPRETATSPKGL